MAEKTSQTNSSSNNLPSVPAVAPTSDTPYIQPIIGKLGYDTKHPDIFGIGASPDNGVSFRVFASFDGLVFNDNDIDAIWDNGTSEKVKSEVNSATAEIPAVKSAADEAVKKADSAIASSKVNSDAIVAQSEAISEAKDAMDRATAEIQQTAANAASDAAKIRADVARVQNEVDTAKAANSASVEALKSDVSAAKQDLADMHDSLTKAQAAAEESQKAIDNSIAKINSDIEQDRKDIASAQQANADTAKQLDTYSKQAQDQGKTIKSIQDKQDGFTATLADVQGNVSQVSDKVDGLSASLKDTQGNVATVKAQADQLNATLTDHAKSIATLTASAKELSSTLEDADGRLNNVEQTAQTNSSTLSDVQGDLSQVKQQADGLVTTLKDAQGDIDQLQQTAKGTAEQISDVKGDITNLQKDVNGIKLTIADHDKNIHTLQADSKTLKDDMADAQGNISKFQKTATDLTSEMQDHSGRLSKVEQTASTLINEFSDQQGHLNRVEQTAQGTQQTVANQQGQINKIKTDASGIHETLTGQGNQIANISVTLSGLNSKYEGVSGDLNNLKSQAQWATVTSAVDLNNVKTPCHEFLKGTVTNDPNESAWWYLTVEGSEGNRITQTVIADQSNNRYTRRWADGWSAWVKDATQTDVTNLNNRITTNSTQITQNKQTIALKADQSTVNSLSGEVSQNKAQLKVQAGQISSKVSSEDFSALNGRAMQNRGTVNAPDFNTLTQAGYYTVTNPIRGKNYPIGNWGTLEVSGQTVDGNGRLNQKYVGDNNGGTYTRQYNAGTKTWTAWTKGANQNDINTLSGKITKNSTAIDQANKEISLKADQTEVDKVKGTASQNSSRLDTMANEIKSKVTSTDVNNIVDGKGYATTSTVQSLITQKAGKINESITDLDAKYKAKDGVNLATKTGNVSLSGGYNSNKSIGYISLDTINDLCGKYMTISVDVEWSGWKSGNQNRIGYELQINYDDGSTDYIGCWLTPTTANGKQRVNATHKIKDQHVESLGEGNAYIQMNCTSAKVSHLKIERGTVATPWTPDPYDNATVTQFQQITATLDGLKSTVVNKADTSQITQLSNLIQSKVSSNDFTSKISQLSNDINARVSKGDLMSQINIEAGQTLIQSKKLFLDADSVVFSGKAFIPDAAIENLSLDKLTTGHITVPIADKYGNQIELGNDGINVSSALEPIDWSGSGTGYQDDKSRFNFIVSSHGMSFTNHIEYGKSTVKTHASDDYQFLNLTPDVLHYTNGSTDQVKVPSGMTMYVPVNATSTLGPKSPGGFFAIGHEQIGDNGATSDKTIDIAYVAKQINGWKQGLHVNTTVYSKPAGASHNMRTAWVSWSQWDAGEHYPAIISDGKWWGGICFPSTGKVTLFDPYGHAMWLTQGNTPYSAWGDDYYS